MKILDALRKEAIVADLKSRDKQSVLEELVGPISSLTGVAIEELVRVLMVRESLGSTGIGLGIGIPHGKLKGIDSLILGFGRSRKGVDFQSIDGKPTHIFFLLLTPESAFDAHLKMLAQISRILKNQFFRERLMGAETCEELFEIIRHEDESLQ
jgi:PTS system nitrogen regulatory IIA component